MKNLSTLVVKAAGSGAVALTIICFHISVLCCNKSINNFIVCVFHCCTFLSSVLELPAPVEAIIHKADKQGGITSSSAKRKTPGDSHSTRRSQANNPRGLSSAHTDRAKAVYWTGAVYSYRNMRDGEQRTRLHLNSNGSAIVVDFDLARPPPFYTATSGSFRERSRMRVGFHVRYIYAQPPRLTAIMDIPNS